jgi:hypothetical protein
MQVALQRQRQQLTLGEAVGGVELLRFHTFLSFLMSETSVGYGAHFIAPLAPIFP